MFHWYGLIVGISVVVGWSIAERIVPKVRTAVGWIIGLGLVGARLYHVVDFWEYYRLNWEEITAVGNGGLGIWGGIAGGILGWYWGTRGMSKSERWQILSASVTGLPLAQAIGRLGNAVNGEFLETVWILPWWGAEAVLDLCLFGVMWRLSRQGVAPQGRVGVYLAGYGVIRLVLEFWRENNWIVAGLGTAQWVGLAAGVIGYLIWRQSSVRE